MMNSWQTSLENHLRGEDSLDKIYQEVDACKQCELFQLEVNQKRSKRAGADEPSKLVLVAQNPSFWRRGNRDLYSSKSGKFLRRLLAEAGIDREKVFVTNVVKCSTLKNEKPSVKAIRVCQLYLYRELELLDPKLIVALGAVAMKLFGARVGQFSKFRDWRVYGIYHPAYCLRGGIDEQEYDAYVWKLKGEVDSWI